MEGWPSPCAHFHKTNKCSGILVCADVMYRILPRWDNKYGKCEHLCPLSKAWLTLCQFSQSYNHSDTY